jgi:hypothetical protein
LLVGSKQICFFAPCLLSIGFTRSRTSAQHQHAAVACGLWLVALALARKKKKATYDVSTYPFALCFWRFSSFWFENTLVVFSSSSRKEATETR